MINKFFGVLTVIVLAGLIGLASWIDNNNREKSFNDYYQDHYEQMKKGNYYAG